MRSMLLFCLAAAMLLAPQARGQYSRRRGPVAATANAGPYNGPAVTFRGTLKAVTKKEFVIDLDKANAADEAETLTFRVSKKTKVTNKDKEVKLADLAVGTHLLVDATREGDQKLAAVNVQVAAAGGADDHR